MAQKPAFQTILFPVDFSKMSEVTVPYVRGLAELTGATVTLLHVVPWLSAWYGTCATEIHPAIAGDQVLRGLEAEQAVRLERFREQYFKDVASRTSVKSGAVAESIADAANDAGADLIMMPTRGLGPSRRFLIGSTTAKVLHDGMDQFSSTPIKAILGLSSLVVYARPERSTPRFPEGGRTPASCFGSKLSFVTAIPSMVGGPGEERRIRSSRKNILRSAWTTSLARCSSARLSRDRTSR